MDLKLSDFFSLRNDIRNRGHQYKLPYTFLAAVLVQDITSLLTVQQGYETTYLLILASLALTLLNVVLV